MPTIQAELEKWKAPNFARLKMSPKTRQDGMTEPPAIPVADLPASTLREMANAWLEDLYAKANKEPDWRFD